MTRDEDADGGTTPEVLALRAEIAALELEVRTLRGEFRALRGWYKAQILFKDAQVAQLRAAHGSTPPTESRTT